MRKMACARTQNSDTFDVVATTNDRQAAPSVCPIATHLSEFTQDFNLLLRFLMEAGIVRNNRGHLEFAEMHSSCPFAQAQQKTQPLVENPS